MRSFLLLLTTLLSLSLVKNTEAQDQTDTPFGQGLINTIASDSSWSTKIAFRFQTQYEGIFIDNEAGAGSGAYSDRFRVRRARIKGDGWATKSRRLKYKFEYDVHNGFVLDAVVKWVFDKNRNWELWFGQTKLPGNMERVISSQKLQFVDRSLLNSSFTLDRDAGVQLHGKQKLSDDFTIKEKFAFSQGEGLNQTGRSEGYGLTARLELFPCGTFKDAYIASSLKRHKRVKLMLAATFDLNNDALRSRGQGGGYLDSRLNLQDLQTVFIDAHLKYKGISWMTEYANRTVADGSPVVSTLIDVDGMMETISDTYYTGSAINSSLGYLLPSNWELAVRYTGVTPEKETGNPDLTQYGVAISRYIVGHNLKVQSDFNLLQTEGAPDQLMFRLQTEFNF